MMSNAPDSQEPVRLLSRFHSSTVLKKYGSSQKGLCTRKIKGKDPVLCQPPELFSAIKQIMFWASNTAKLFKYVIKPTNIINLFRGALASSVPLVLHGMPTVLALVFLLSSCVCKCVVACMKILSYFQQT